MHILSIIAPNFQFPWKSKSRCEYDDDAGKKKGKASAKALDSRIVAGQFERASELLTPRSGTKTTITRSRARLGFSFAAVYIP